MRAIGGGFRFLSEMHNPLSMLAEASVAAYYSGYACQSLRNIFLQRTDRFGDEQVLKA